MTPLTEQYELEVSCQVGGATGRGGWGLATLAGDDGTLDRAIEAIRKHPSVGSLRIESRKPGLVDLTVNVVRCKACEILMQSKAFMVYPVGIRKGRMKWLLVMDSGKSLQSVVRRLRGRQCDVRVERVTPLRGKEVLTIRQEEVLRAAFASGYFDYPRRTGSAKLAGTLGISASTLSEVLRAAQRRILTEHLHA